MTPETRNSNLIKRIIHDAGGHVRKCSYEGHVGCPDLLVMLPGKHFYIEVKAPGEKTRPTQNKEIELLRQAGATVYVLDTPELIYEVLHYEIQA